MELEERYIPKHKVRIVTAASLFGVGYNYSVPLDKWNLTDMAVDYLFLGDNNINFETPGTLGLIYNSQSWLPHKNHKFIIIFLKFWRSAAEAAACKSAAPRQR